jgi:hypothetical protein
MIFRLLSFRTDELGVVGGVVVVVNGVAAESFGCI